MKRKMPTSITPAEPVHIATEGRGTESHPDADVQLKMPPSPLSERLSEIVVSALRIPLSTSTETKPNSGNTHDRNGTSPPSLLSEGERWLGRLKDDDRIRVEEGIESILTGSLALAEKKCYDAAVKERRGQSEARRDRSLKDGQPTAKISPPRHRLSDTSGVRTTAEIARIHDRESSTRNRELAYNDDSRVSQRRDPDLRRGDASRTRAEYDRDRKRPASPTQDRSHSYVYASRDRYYGNAHGPQHLPYEFHGTGQGPAASPMHGYDNRPPPRDAGMPPPSHYNYGSYNPPDDINRYRPPHTYAADYKYPVDNRTSHRDRDWNRRPRSPDRDRLQGASDDRGSREERDGARRRRDKESIRSLSSSAASPGLHQSREEQRRGSERDDLDRHSAPREGRTSERTYRGRSRSPEPPRARLDSRPSEKERQSEHNHKAHTSNDVARRPSSPLPENPGAGRDLQRRIRTSPEDGDSRKERGGSERRAENGRDRHHRDNEKRREDGGHHERSSQKEIVVEVDRAPPDDASPRSRKSSRRKRHRSRRSRSRSRSPSSEGGRHRKSSRRRGRRSRGDSSVDSSPDDDESDRRGGRKHRHRSRRRRHRSRSDSGDESHAKKRSKKKRKDRRKSDVDDRRKGEGDRKESGRDRDERGKRKDPPPGS